MPDTSTGTGGGGIMAGTPTKFEPLELADAPKAVSQASHTAAAAAGSTFTLSSLASSLAARPLRHLVSGSKRRIQVDGWDLDLTYITPHVIALGLPASGLLEPIYRNPLGEVRSFIDSRHHGQYVMVNLCDERDYSDADWPGAARVLRYPFADHHAPALRALHAFCKRVQGFMSHDPERILCVHCKAGKGRTGVMICAYLLLVGQPECPSADAALHFFRSTRTTDLDAVNQPSQVRCVHHFARLLQADPTDVPRLLAGNMIVLRSVMLSCAPTSLFFAAPSVSPAAAAKNGASDAGADGAIAGKAGAVATGAIFGSSSFAGLTRMSPWHLRLEVLTVSATDAADGVRSTRKHVCSVGPLRCAPGEACVRFELPSGGLRLRGDVELALYASGGMVVSDEQLGWVTMHTSWMPDGGVLRKADVDGVNKDARFPPHWELSLDFSAEHDARSGLADAAFDAGAHAPEAGLGAEALPLVPPEEPLAGGRPPPPPLLVGSTQLVDALPVELPHGG